MSYMTISSQENHHFSLCSYFHAHPTTLLLKILGGPMHGPSPPPQILGDRPPSPPRSPPLLYNQATCTCLMVVEQGKSVGRNPTMSPHWTTNDSFWCR